MFEAHFPSQDGRIEIFSPLVSNDRVEKEDIVLEKKIEPAEAVHAMVINGDRGEVMIPVRPFLALVGSWSAACSRSDAHRVRCGQTATKRSMRL